MIVDALKPLIEEFGLRVSGANGFHVRLDGVEVFVSVRWDVGRSGEIGVQIGQRAGVVREFERPYQLSEVLRVAGRYELPEAQMEEIVAFDSSQLGEAVARLGSLLKLHARPAFSGDRDFFIQLDAQRDVDCFRYEYERALHDASRAAFVAWSEQSYDTVIRRLKPYKDKLTEVERQILESSEALLQRS